MSNDEIRLAALARLHILDTPPEPEFDDIVQLARSLCGTPVALVSLVGSDRQWFKARIGFDACETPLDQSVCRFAIEEDAILVIPDLAKDPRTRVNPLVADGPRIRFYAGAVLRDRDGIAIGSLCVIDGAPRPQGLSSEQRDNLLALARMAMALIQQRALVAARTEALAEGHDLARRSLDRAIATQGEIERLAAEERRLRTAQEAGGVGTFEIDIATDRLVPSAAFCQIFGIAEAADYPAGSIERLVVPADRGVLSNRRKRVEASADTHAEYRIMRENDGALRWISRRSKFERDAGGRPVRMSGAVLDVTERKLEELRRNALIAFGDEIREATTIPAAVAIAGRFLGETLGATRAGYAFVDRASERYRIGSDWTAEGQASIAGDYPLSQFSETIARLRLGDPIVVANIPAAPWLASDADGYARIATKAQIDVPLMQAGHLIGILFIHNAAPRTWSEGEVEFALAVADRTYAAVARLKADADQTVLNEELSHRLKNTLAMVQAIASQTMKKSDPQAVNAFNERIATLSTAHDILLQQNWTGADIAAIVGSVMAQHGMGGRIEWSGPRVPLGAKASLSLSLLLHEMATNALKYGALSNDDGRVSISWSIEHSGMEPQLSVVWTERGGPPAAPPTRRGFGSRLIAMGLSGTRDVVLDYGSNGLVASFGAPLSIIDQR